MDVLPRVTRRMGARVGRMRRCREPRLGSGVTERQDARTARAARARAVRPGSRGAGRGVRRGAFDQRRWPSGATE